MPRNAALKPSFVLQQRFKLPYLCLANTPQKCNIKIGKENEIVCKLAPVNSDKPFLLFPSTPRAMDILKECMKHAPSQDFGDILAREVGVQAKHYRKEFLKGFSSPSSNESRSR